MYKSQFKEGKSKTITEPFTSEQDVRNKAIELSKTGEYVLVDVSFGKVIYSIASYVDAEAPSMVHPKFKGYFHKGTFKPFSHKQIVRHQNIGVSNS